MPYIHTPKHNIEPAKIKLAIEILNELEQSNKKLRMELMKYSVHGGFDEIYLEMKKRNLLT